MKRFTCTIAILVAAAVPAVAQHEGHQMLAEQPQGLDTAQCAAGSLQARGAAEAAIKRLELARQTNDAAALRTAVDDLSGALGFIRARLEACIARPAPPAPGATVPETPMMQPGASQPAPAASAPSASPPASGMGGMAGMDHSKMGLAIPPAAAEVSKDQQADPVCKMKVDPKTSPKAEYQGKTYYFCSESDRQKFLANPAKYLKDNPK